MKDMEKRAYDGDKKRKKDLKTEWTMTAKKKKKKKDKGEVSCNERSMCR